MLTRKTPSTISTLLDVTCQGETLTFGVVYNNLPRADYDALAKHASESAGEKYPDNEGMLWLEMHAVLLSGLIKSWESEYDTDVQSLLDANADRPGLLHGLLRGYHQSREAQVAKNSKR